MVNAEEALRIILEAAPLLKSETVLLARSFGRTVAEDVVARGNLPQFPNSSMDGFAVRRSDVDGATSSNPVTLVVAGESRAGTVFNGPLPKKSAIRIMTGARVPEGADAVIPHEETAGDGQNAVSVSATPRLAENIRLAGEDIAAGESVMRAGELITPAHAGVLASLGYARIRVCRRPRVALIATGDEIVEPGKRLRDGQIYNSTSFALQALVVESGAKVRFLGIGGDKKSRIRTLLRDALRDDVVIVTGGVSVGRYDVVKEVLAEIGVEILFWKVNIRPGRPMVFGAKEGSLVFGLPGNPVSTGVTFLQFVRPALLKMLGHRELSLTRLQAVSDGHLKKSDGKRHYLRGIVRQEGGALRVRTTGSQSSGVLSSLLKANCLIVLPETVSEVPPGGEVTVELLPSASIR